MRLRGKTALITGAAKRIGRQIALTLSKKGVSVVLHYDHSGKEARSLKREIEMQGGEAFLVQAHFGSSPAAFEKTLKQFEAAVYDQVRHVDILVNNASIFYPKQVEKINEKDWDDNLAVNLKFPFFLSQVFGLKMRKQERGKIINLTDWTALKPHPNYLPYAISKAGLAAATVGLARALAPHVQVISIAPGPILAAKGMTAKMKKAVIQRTLLKRMGDPRDIAETVRFFCEDTDYITGAFLPVDGGALIA